MGKDSYVSDLPVGILYLEYIKAYSWNYTELLTNRADFHKWGSRHTHFHLCGTPRGIPLL